MRMKNEATARNGVKFAAVAVTGLLGLGVATTSVSALLQAQAANPTAQTITSGTLKVEQANSGNGFATQIDNLAPGDIVNRYVDYTNSGTLPAKALKLKVTPGTSTLLTSSATRGLQLTVTRCSTTWNTSDGSCNSGGTTTQVLNSSITALTAGDLPFSGVTTLAASEVMHLQFKLQLPNDTNNEVTTNGTLPADTIQGLSTSLIWTFTETQRDGVTTNS